ncbi:MAG: 1,4-dihydroxy-2-naphthoate polyprenyltransferase [Halothermotrichaceae bacterium]
MLNRFFDLVEIRTKVASILPFLLGTVYVYYHFEEFVLIRFLLMLIGVLTLDMAVTAANNYYDFKRAHRKQGYNYEQHNALVKHELSKNTVIMITILLLLAAAVSGLFLFLKTDLIVLFLGVLSFITGIGYSYGPVPISRTPYGELLSGLLMGFIIIFIAVNIHLPETIIIISYINGMINISVNLMEVIYIFLYSVPVIFSISNIMLANNISDIKDDYKNNRYTLPIYIGKKTSLKLFRYLYYLIYLDIVVIVYLKIVPVYCLLLLLTVIPVKSNINVFNKRQSKKDTFVLSVKNFVIINFSYLLFMIAALISKKVL